MIAIKAAIFLMLIGLTAWAGGNLLFTAWGAYPQWHLIAIGGFLGCAYAMTDLLWRSREFLGFRGEYRPRRRMAWGPWRP